MIGRMEDGWRWEEVGRREGERGKVRQVNEIKASR